ncbi:hypothetical protein PALB_18470 [Pseudoalteromonas luteoviolacea B = ATCC 29581]|nr:hypothetical protein PALB_18470 [Pseudoalteromonas luteoviolacea B = ATCC 29581]
MAIGLKTAWRKALLIMAMLLGNTHVSAASLNVITENFPDYQYVDKDGQLKGQAADLVRNVLNTSGIDYDITVQNWAVAYNAALRRNNTCLFSIARMPAREEQFHWLFPIGRFTTSFYALTSSHIKLNSLVDAKKYKTAVIRNNFSHVYLMERGFNEDQHLILISSFDNVFNLIETRKGSLDLVILSDAQYRHKLSQGEISEPMDKLLTIEEPYSELYFSCSKQTDPKIIEKIKLAYTQVQVKK